MLWVDFPDTGPALCCNGKRYFVVVEPLVTKKPQTRWTMNVVATVSRNGTSTKNDFAMGVAYPCSCHTPKAPPKFLSCEVEGGLSYRVLDMHVKFAKQFTHYLILFQELESNKKVFEFCKGVVLKNQKKPPRTATAGLWINLL